MSYNAEMGEIDQGLIRQMLAAGDEIPEHISRRPRETPFMAFYISAFFDLDSERSHGHGLTKIPRSKIMDYARECGLYEDEAYEFFRLIRQVDDDHINKLAAKMTQK